MDPVFLKEVILVLLFLIVLFCVGVPLKFAETLKNRGIDLFHSARYKSLVSILNCFAAGIFLGTCLLHLFPDVRQILDDALDELEVTGVNFPIPEFTIALGFFLLLTIEQIISYFRELNYYLPEPEGEHDQGQGDAESQPIIYRQRSQSPPPPPEVMNHEQNTSIRVVALILALSVHSVFEGIAIGVENTVESVLQITGALLIHKIVIAFSLGLTLSQSPMSTMKSMLFGSVFAIASPIGIGIGLIVTSLETLSGSLIVGSLQGMAAGTFLYVTFLEVLPNEFRAGHLHLPKLISFILGFSVICAAILIFPDDG